jgi:hypothetical protein
MPQQLALPYAQLKRCERPLSPLDPGILSLNLQDITIRVEFMVQHASSGS